MKNDDSLVNKPTQDFGPAAVDPWNRGGAFYFLEWALRTKKAMPHPLNLRGFGLAVGPGSRSLRPEAQGSKASRAKRVEVIDDFLSEDVGIGKVVGLFEACVSESKDIEAG